MRCHLGNREIDIEMLGTVRQIFINLEIPRHLIYSYYYYFNLTKNPHHNSHGCLFTPELLMFWRIFIDWVRLRPALPRHGHWAEGWGGGTGHQRCVIASCVMRGLCRGKYVSEEVSYLNKYFSNPSILKNGWSWTKVWFPGGSSLKPWELMCN